jgi:CTP synthase (UTP-ammonia lyase)
VGIAGAEHEEVDPSAAELVISRLACSLRGVEREVVLVPGTLAAEAYGEERVDEQFLCRFGVNPAYRDRLFTKGLRVSGTDAGGEVRVAENTVHPFFMGTLFVPQMTSEPGRPHPLMLAFVRAAARFKAARKDDRSGGWVLGGPL